jgi:DNA-directed RNA polymerase specialized sigma24 family protein
MAICDDDQTELWISGLREGDPRAVRDIWERYFPKLVQHARNCLGAFPRRTFDEEDIALSVLDTLRRGAAEGRFAHLRSGTNLWLLLVVMTRQKVADRIRREGRKKRGSGRLRGDSVFHGIDTERRPGFDGLAGDALTPEFLVSMDEQYRRLMGQLRDDVLRRVAVLRLEGYSTEEIARRLDLSVRAIQRKVRLIFDCWARELAQ